MNIYIGNSSISDGTRFFAIYTNNDPTNGFPYAQVMILDRLENDSKFKKDSETEDAETEDTVEFPYPFDQTLQNKKIGIKDELLFYQKVTDVIDGNYTIYFNFKERYNFYERLKVEIEHAKQQVFLLGHEPNHFPADQENFKEKYFRSHATLIEKKISSFIGFCSIII